MPSIIFWLIVVPVTLAFILGFMANLFRTIGHKAAETAKNNSSSTGESSNPLPNAELVEKAGA